MILRTTILISHSKDLYETPAKDGRLYNKDEIRNLLNNTTNPDNIDALHGTIVWHTTDDEFVSLSTRCHRVSRIIADNEAVTIEASVYEDRSGGWVLLEQYNKGMEYGLAVVWDEIPGEDGVMKVAKIDSFPAVPTAYFGPLILSETPTPIDNPYCIPLRKTEWWQQREGLQKNLMVIKYLCQKKL